MTKKIKLHVVTGLFILFAVSAVRVYGYDRTIRPSNIWASSTLYDGIGDYSAWNTQDNDLNTAWVEGAAGNGIGEYLAFSVPSGTSVSGIMVSPGYLKSEDIFYKNSAPTKLRVYSGNQSATVDCSDMANTYYTNSDANWGSFYFDTPITSYGTVYVEIMEVREGRKYNDTCINELQLLQGESSSVRSYSALNLNLDWYKSGKTYYSYNGRVWAEYWNDGRFQIVRDTQGVKERFQFTRNGYNRVDPDGSIVYTIPERKVLFAYYPSGDYIHYYTRYEDEYYY